MASSKVRTIIVHRLDRMQFRLRISILFILIWGFIIILKVPLTTPHRSKDHRETGDFGNDYVILVSFKVWDWRVAPAISNLLRFVVRGLHEEITIFARLVF